MNTLLRLTRHPYEEPYHVELLLEACDGRTHASIPYYTSVHSLVELGVALEGFPVAGRSEHVYEVGSEEPERRSAYHIRLRFFVIGQDGSCGIDLHCKCMREEPEFETADLTIETRIDGIKRLGGLLTGFGKLDHRVLEWDGVEGCLKNGSNRIPDGNF